MSSQTVKTDENSNAALAIPTGIANPSATDPNGNTSEFGSIINMQFSDCQGILQRVIADSSRNFYLDATWAGENIPATQYSNYPTWDGTQWVDDVQKTGLNVKVTVGGQDLVYTEPLPQNTTAYTVQNWSWTTYGHTATPLSEGTYDVILTLTDLISGLSMTKTYPGAVKVALPKVNYTTTFTNNATPTLVGTTSEVSQGSGLEIAYILPAGSAAPDTTIQLGSVDYVKQRALLYVPDKDANGNLLNTGSFKVITDKNQLIAAATARMIHLQPTSRQIGSNTPLSGISVIFLARVQAQLRPLRV